MHRLSINKASKVGCNILWRAFICNVPTLSSITQVYIGYGYQTTW